MSGCRYTVTFKSVRHEGDDIGDDWTYTIKVNGEERTIEGDGTNKEFGGEEAPRWSFEGGDCGSDVTLGIFIKAVEEDLFFDDVGSNQKQLAFPCPDEGEGPNAYPDQMVRVSVQENRGVSEGGVTRIDFFFDVEVSCG